MNEGRNPPGIRIHDAVMAGSSFGETVAHQVHRLTITVELTGQRHGFDLSQLAAAADFVGIRNRVHFLCLWGEGEIRLGASIQNE